MFVLFSGLHLTRGFKLFLCPTLSDLELIGMLHDRICSLQRLNAKKLN